MQAPLVTLLFNLDLVCWTHLAIRFIILSNKRATNQGPSTIFTCKMFKMPFCVQCIYILSSNYFSTISTTRSKIGRHQLCYIEKKGLQTQNIVIFLAIKPLVCFKKDIVWKRSQTLMAPKTVVVIFISSRCDMRSYDAFSAYKTCFFAHRAFSMYFELSNLSNFRTNAKLFTFYYINTNSTPKKEYEKLNHEQLSTFP